MKNLYLIFLLVVSCNIYANYPDSYIYDSIKRQRVYHCFASKESNVRIAYDGNKYNIYHYPFTNYHNIKWIKSEKIDDEYPMFRDTYAELFHNRKIATLKITSQGNDILEAFYKGNKSKEISLYESSFDLTGINAICFNDINQTR